MGTISIRWYGMEDFEKWERLESKGQLGEKRKFMLKRWREIAAKFPSLRQIEVSGKRVSISKLEYPEGFTAINRRYETQTLIDEWKVISFLWVNPGAADILITLHETLLPIFAEPEEGRNKKFFQPELQAIDTSKIRSESKDAEKIVTDEPNLFVIVHTKLSEQTITQRLEAAKEQIESFKALMNDRDSKIKVFVVYDQETQPEPLPGS